MLSQISWGVIAAALLVLELAVPGSLICIWFMLGAVAALLVSLVCPVFWVQVLVFLAVSITTLVLTRPLVADKIKARFVPTNADQVIGKVARVIRPIAPNQKGRVQLEGLGWAAAADTPLAEGEECRVLAISGATLHVAPLTDRCEAVSQPDQTEEVTV